MILKGFEIAEMTFSIAHGRSNTAIQWTTDDFMSFIHFTCISVMYRFRDIY